MARRLHGSRQLAEPLSRSALRGLVQGDPRHGGRILSKHDLQKFIDHRAIAEA